MNIRHLRYFVTVADLGSITRAAEELGMEQPPLSQQIRQFEQKLGVKLFERQTRGVKLTEIGATLIPRARAILELQHQFQVTAEGLARGEVGHIRLGLAGAVPLLPVIPLAIRSFRDIAPDVTLSLEESNTPALCAALHESSTDIAIVRPPVPDPARLSVSHLLDEPTVIALPRGHRLTEEPVISLDMVADDPLIIFPRELGPGFHDAILSAYQLAGVTPILGQQAPQIAGTVPLVAAGMGVSVVPRSLCQIHAGGVTFHTISEPAPRATLAVAIRSGQNMPIVSRFVKILRTTCREWEKMSPEAQFPASGF
ncbi:LysR family transcriptional regulator [Acetobacter tropicalis]|uniref:LysR family transcriptional regulator n=2 Tax=Acetobacter TaxID=434 RepID=A0A0U5B9X6_9PROT|nr:MULTISPECIES: LysR family transcriptional regulator [Acetobacter]ATJ89686.1 LysR family transcriptional regulator [Acetobacter tropicalis]KXV47751.1 LysR family transcriptional regulator [Acetobacter tropicalis]KXV58439.1 LysR family transcriptional regulator [Acetobacter tropicalis]KXV60797.1 LysR family transcriptional regulator [Acetobacter senegalensis]MCC6105505.1 LysR family transcriptional regulator [Acetobacter sp.]